MEITVLSKTEFKNFITSFSFPYLENIDFLYEVYSLAIGAIDDFAKSKIISITSVDSYMVIYYLLGEFLYSIFNRNKQEIDEFVNNESIKAQMASVTADKYLSIEKLSHNEKTITNQFLPPISSLLVYVNFMQQILDGYTKGEQSISLINDLLKKSISIMRCILKLLVDGYETEALSCWRTLHECECSLIILNRYKDEAISRYLKHMQYGIAFKNGIKEKDIQDKIFLQIKAEMKDFDLKSKDMKKYIEYGWLTFLDDVKKDPNFKFNFRDGLQKVAGLTKYSDSYQLASEILHSTPLLIYSNKEYFYHLTLTNTYESFFRLEEVFVPLFTSRIGKEQTQHYEAMRNIYYSQLVNIYQREMRYFTRQDKKEEKGPKA